MALASDHIAKGSGYKTTKIDENQAMAEFEARSEEYEAIIEDSNARKLELRTDIASTRIRTKTP